MKILFDLGHPAHFHLFKNVIRSLNKKSHQTFILIKKKDVLEELLKKSGFEYQNILPNGRKDFMIGIAIAQFKKVFSMLKFCLNNKPEILIGTSIAISHVGKLLGIPSINVNEDDASVVPWYAKLAYPWATNILAPEVCSVGKWIDKKIEYSSYHELAYLHPNHFTPNKSIVDKYFHETEKYFLVRFAKLTAHHDYGITGINNDIAYQIISLLLPYGKVYITSERTLNSDFEKYRIDINPIEMHHILAFAEIFIGDSQTMAAEAAVLGVPFIRFNDFVGRISYLDELENKYQLGYGIKTDKVDLLYKKVEELLQMPNKRKVFQKRRKKMLSEKIDYASFLTWFIENYPQSIKVMKNNPNKQYNFR